uniref:Uncharacterized protein n=1 Tax=Oryza meridionalis TaxID=40149 RepID=A0A0E0D5S0_9ORYZ
MTPDTRGLVQATFRRITSASTSRPRTLRLRDRCCGLARSPRSHAAVLHSPRTKHLRQSRAAPPPPLAARGTAALPRRRLGGDPHAFARRGSPSRAWVGRRRSRAWPAESHVAVAASCARS